MSGFEFAVKQTLLAEGGWSDHPDDPGKRTNHGITEKLAERYGFDVKDISQKDAESIYKQEFWDKLRCGDIDSKYIAAELFDTAVLMGHHAAVEIAQKACNLMGEQLAVDGRIGPKTLGAINALVPRYEKNLYAAMNLYQGSRFIDLYEADPKRRRSFIKGWLMRLVRFPEMLPP